MVLHSYRVSEQTLKAMQGVYPRVESQLPGLAQGRGKVVMFPQLTQHDLLKLAQVAFSGYVEIGNDADQMHQMIRESLKTRNHTITVSLTTCTFAAVNAAHVLVSQFEMGVPLSERTRDHMITALHEGILRAIIANLELWEWAQILSDLPIFFDMFYDRIKDPGFGQRRITAVIDGGVKEVGFTVAFDASVVRVPQQDDKRTLIESLADRMTVSKTAKYWRQFLIINKLVCMFESYLDEHLSVLISSSNDELRDQLQNFFHELGIHQIMVTSTNKDALQKIFEYHPTIAFVDAGDRDINIGLFSALVRQHPSGAELVLILMVNMDDALQRGQVYSCKADDVIVVPIIKEEVRYRLLDCMRTQVLNSELTQANQMLRSEMEEAKRMQESLLPGAEMLDDIKARYGVTIASHVHPSAMLGGDMWGVTPLNDHQLAIYTVDFSGHGVMAAINTFRLHAILQEHPDQGAGPGAYLEQLNELMRRILPKGNFATMFYGVCDFQRNVLEYACAAAPSSPVWYDNEEKVHVLDGTGFPLGITQSARYETTTISFPPRSTLMLYSDALFETEDNRGMYFSEEKIHNYMAPLVHGELKVETLQALELLKQHFQSRFGRHLQDDLTICLFQRS